MHVPVVSPCTQDHVLFQDNEPENEATNLFTDTVDVHLRCPWSHEHIQFLYLPPPDTHTHYRMMKGCCVIVLLLTMMRCSASTSVPP